MARQANNKTNPTEEKKVVTPETENEQTGVTAAPAVTENPASATSAVLSEDTKVEVKSLVPKVFYTCSKTHEPFSWVEVGDIQEMTYQQIKVMRAKHPRYFTEKWLLPLNQDVLKKLNLDKIYSTNITRADLKKLYGNDVDEVENLLSNLSGSARAELTQKVIDAAKKGKIVNIKIIRLLEKQLGVELMQLIDG